MKRRVMGGMIYNAEPKLVKLTSNPGVEQNYTIEDGYRYFDLLVVGGGGAGGTNSGGGGGSGAIVYVKDFDINKIQNKAITYRIAEQVSSNNNGDYTDLIIDGNRIRCTGGESGSIDGFTTSSSKRGDGATLPDVFSILSNYTDSPNINIAICSNGGGAAGMAAGYNGYGGGSGASMSSSGISNSGSTGGAYVSNQDGTGGYRGGDSGSGRGGTGQKYNNVVIPIVSLFDGGGRSGNSANGLNRNASGSGGGAAGYGSGGDGGAAGSGTNGTAGSYGAGGGGGGGSNHKGGNGGQGIICLYYHN